VLWDVVYLAVSCPLTITIAFFIHGLSGWDYSLWLWLPSFFSAVLIAHLLLWSRRRSLVADP